jgi:hypothetical protein
LEGDPYHPIGDRPWEYELVGLSYYRALGREAESYLDLTLQKGDTIRRLRFLGPQDLQITAGFPYSGGLCILDVSGRGLEGLKVRVYNFEPLGGCPTFWARAVIDLDKEATP